MRLSGCFICAIEFRIADRYGPSQSKSASPARFVRVTRLTIPRAAIDEMFNRHAGGMHAHAVGVEVKRFKPDRERNKRDQTSEVSETSEV